MTINYRRIGETVLVVCAAVVLATTVGFCLFIAWLGGGQR